MNSRGRKQSCPSSQQRKGQTVEVKLRIFEAAIGEREVRSRLKKKKKCKVHSSLESSPRSPLPTAPSFAECPHTQIYSVHRDKGI